MRAAAKIEIKSKLTDLYQLASDTGECISALQTAFIYHTSKPLQEYGSKFDEVGNITSPLSAALKEAASEDEGMRPYVAVPEHLANIWINLGRLSGLIDKKNMEKVLFSDRAVNETIYLLQRLVEMLRPAADMILARNMFLSKYVQESHADIERMADEYATLHENRLITGECLPVASSIYVSMLGAIKSIAWHTKEIALALGK